MGLQSIESETLERAIFHTRTPKSEAGGTLEECVVKGFVSGTGPTSGVYFTRPTFDNNATTWGPAPYAWAGTAVPGSRVLIAWVGAPNENPWALGWWPVS